MANIKGSKIDNTHLSIDHCMDRGFLHRDYIAHCFRWSHVVKFLHKQSRYNTFNILDVGCGVDVPLARTMYSSKMTNRAGMYTGIDVNKLEVPPMLLNKAFNIELFGRTDLVKWETEKKFDLVVSFEVLEHIEPEHMINMLNKIKSLMTNDGTFIMSTPCYDKNSGAAANHVNEITYKTLGSILEHLGFNTNVKYGTFASQVDYKGYLFADGFQKMFDRLNEYYDSNVLSNIFAPMYPEHSRNCLWQLTNGQTTNFTPLQEYVNCNPVLGSSHKFEWDKALKLMGVTSYEPSL